LILKVVRLIEPFILDTSSTSPDKMNLNHLSAMSVNVTQNHGTEPPFSSPLNNNKNRGLYSCIVCNTPAFRFD
jgi:peptide-methionine (R)-S-oxide reductase